MAYIDYLDPSRTGDLNYQRLQRTAALDRELGYDVAGYSGNQQRIQARQQQYGRDLNRLNGELDAAGLDPFYDRNRQAFVESQRAAQGLRDQAEAAYSVPSAMPSNMSVGRSRYSFDDSAINRRKYGGAQGPFETAPDSGRIPPRKAAPSGPMPSDTFAAETTPKRPEADYSTVGQNQQPRTDALARYGGFWNGGRWNPYGAPNAV